MTALPPVIPIFPLPNVVLFPGVPLPLHIFEPRYRDMVRDADAGADRLIGMVLLRGNWRADYYGNPDVFSVGCAGHMMNVEPLADGRSNILLHGVREFVIEEERREHRYRQACVHWRTPLRGELAPGGRARLEELLRRYVARPGCADARKILAEGTIADAVRVNFFCYALALAPVEKQALLEAETLRERAERLCEILEFALGAGGGPGPENERYH
jgi:Lon protease-like protein